MIDAQIDNLYQSGRIILTQDMALSWRQNIWVISVVTSIILVIGVVFALHGAWLILPFAGIEVTAVTGLLYYWYKNNNRMEVLNFSQTSMTLESGVTGPERREKFERFWLKAEFPHQHDHWYMTKVILHYRNTHIEVGKFLNEDDRKILVKHMRNLLPTTH